jgi:hypothetical protein
MLLKLRSSRDAAPPRDRPSDVDPQRTVQAFERKIVEQEDIFYGVALFFEGLSLLLAGQDAVLETYRKQFRNIILSGQDTVAKARQLLAQVQQDPSKAALLTQFAFAPCREHPDPEGMVKRAKVLCQVYEEMFPGRSRAEPFTPEDTLKLIEAAGRKGRAIQA